MEPSSTLKGALIDPLRNIVLSGVYGTLLT